MSIEFFLLRVLICGHVRKGGWRKKHRELGETTLGELLPKALIYIHTAWAKFFFCFWGAGGGWWDSIIALSPTNLRKKWGLKTIFLFFRNSEIICIRICERVL
jgi:hypothetical protein